MKNKAIFIIICCLILIGVASFVIILVYPPPKLSDVLLLSRLMNGSLNIASLIIVNVLLQAGTLKGTVYYRIIMGLISIAILGTLFKIQHWELSLPILAIGLLGIPVTYAIRFIHKKQKNLLSWLKFTWVLLYFVLNFIAIMGVLPYYFNRFSMLILIAAFFVFWFGKDEERPDDELDFDFLKGKTELN